ncbi:MAG TPA: oligosaccharide flippase family protein [Anaerolineales bacterium]|nr:oligosaccharide flippase family protein [Anaerolineales bacterium]
MPPQRFPKLIKKLHQFFDNELFRRVLRNSGYLFSATGVSAFLSMIQGILAARLLGVELFGVLGTITMFVSVLNKLASFRIGELVVKYVGEFDEKNDPQRASAVFKAAMMVEMATSLVAFGLVWFSASLGAQYFAKDISLADLFRYYGIIILFNLVSESSTGLLQISDRFQRLAGWNVLQSIFTLLIITTAYFLNGTLSHILLAYMVGKAVGAFGLMLNALREAKNRWGHDWWKVNLSLLKPQQKELTHFAISTNLSASISLVTKDSEILWVSLFRSNAEVGYYKLALALANMVQLPTSPLPQVTYPELSREVSRKNWKNVRYILRQGSLLAGGYALLATIALTALGRPLISLIYTKEFLPAYPALIILLLGYLVADTFYWRRIALLSFGRPDFPVKLNFILSLLKISAAVILIPRYGYLASAGLLAAFYWLGSLISWQKVRQLLSKGEQSG